MALSELDLPIHAKHYKDGYPLCWTMDQEGLFEASFNESDVTCQDCVDYMEED